MNDEEKLNKSSFFYCYNRNQVFRQIWGWVTYRSSTQSVAMALADEGGVITNHVCGHPLSTYAKLSKKLTFLTPWYTHARVRIRRLEMLVFRKILRTYSMDDLFSNTEKLSNSKVHKLSWTVNELCACLIIDEKQPSKYLQN